MRIEERNQEIMGLLEDERSNEDYFFHTSKVTDAHHVQEY